MITEEASAALRKANKWAQSGLIVSVGPPVETLAQETAGGITPGDKKKTAQTAVCRDRNAELARCCFCDLDILYKMNHLIFAVIFASGYCQVVGVCCRYIF